MSEIVAVCERERVSSPAEAGLVQAKGGRDHGYYGTNHSDRRVAAFVRWWRWLLLEPQKVTIPDAPYLDGTTEHGGRLIQRLAVEDLLPVSVRDLLFPEPEVA